MIIQNQRSETGLKRKQNKDNKQIKKELPKPTFINKMIFVGFFASNYIPVLIYFNATKTKSYKDKRFLSDLSR